MGPSSDMTCVPIKMGNLNTQRIPYEDEGRVWGDIFTSPQMPKIAGKPLYARRKGHETDSPAQSLESTCQHLDLELGASRIVKQ